MRIIWVLHPELAAEYKGREKEVLAGRIGLVEIGDEWQLGEIDDGWGGAASQSGEFPFGEIQYLQRRCQWIGSRGQNSDVVRHSAGRSSAYLSELRYHGQSSPHTPNRNLPGHEH